MEYKLFTQFATKRMNQTNPKLKVLNPERKQNDVSRSVQDGIGLVIMGVFCSVVSGAAAFAFILMVRSSFRDF